MKLNRYKALLAILTIAMKTVAMGEDFGQYMSVTTEYEQPTIQQKIQLPAVQNQIYREQKPVPAQKKLLFWQEPEYKEAVRSAQLSSDTSVLREKLYPSIALQMRQWDPNSLTLSMQPRSGFWNWLSSFFYKNEQTPRATVTRPQYKPFPNQTLDEIWNLAYQKGIINKKQLFEKKLYVPIMEPRQSKPKSCRIIKEKC